MQIEEFTLERIQSLYENTVEFNLSDSGVHPYTLNELLTPEQNAKLLELEIGYGWTNGATELRQSVANLYKNRTSDEVIITNGSAEANFLMVMSLLNAGDELIVFVPNYLQIWGWARALGVTVKEVALKEELGWQPDLDDLKTLITDKTKMITICHPNNPTGSTLPLESMQQLVNFARDYGIYLHADEVYKGSELNGEESPSFADLYEKAIITSGLSKAMALPGLRIGWLVGPENDIYKAWQSKDYTSITTSAVSEYVADIVVQPLKRAEILERSRRILRENVALLSGWLNNNANLFSSILPDAGGMAFVRYNMKINSTELVHKLREERSIMLLPGDVYGMDNYIRLGIGAPKHHIEEGLKHLADYARTNF
ncbi:aminotransferase class I/II-fold pyridoxal phosphate-dependent enzyme [Kordiimonas sp. SCSIO 12610]|uniref:aminotransferase class I/II-fold pyridoxal phosphate-dependent enzyme n=1 Tax=Kordiimonas sp. SCSIO 12610 TaxID=2829597 RepID=UPI00210B16CD|nr:aminotransferase class I/II-fold pyridoxal phosphate-dependent enzyme [Kordiimonas sp. SCSIO 12610]UTW54887.1 aminotransferase class I/II-fold pyridoxal phosphate-dependent enzyme [Kordiimonas sp. SCSIO 12610]